MIAALLSALADLRRPAIIKLLVFGAGLAFVVLLVTVGIVGWMVTSISFFSFGWLNALLDGVAWIGLTLLAIVLFPAVAGAVGALLLDRVALIVERANYPSLPRGRKQPLGEAIFQAVRFLVLTIALNIVALTTLLIPGLHLIVWLSLNGYLLSREYFELVANRWLEPKPARVLRRTNRGILFVSGVMLAALTMVPVINLLVPVLGTAFTVHLFHRIMR